MKRRSVPAEIRVVCNRVTARAAFDRKQKAGARLSAIDCFGDPEDPAFGLTWQPNAEGRRQRLELGVGLAALHATVKRQATDGFFVAHVSVTGTPALASFALIFEACDGSGPKPRFVLPLPFRDELGVFFLHRTLAGKEGHTMYVRSIAGLGTPKSEQGEGLLVTAALWPQPPIRIASAVHLDQVPADGNWRSVQGVGVLATAAHPVAALPLASSESSPEARWVLSLWHDTPYAPWPTPDPFAPGSRLVVDELSGVSSDEIAAVLKRRARRGFRACSIARRGNIQSADAIVVYAPKAQRQPLERRFTYSESTQRSAEHISLQTQDASQVHPLDRWMYDKMATNGARHGQLIISRGDKIPWARAYTFAEAGYPIATLDTAMRVGSISKPIATIPWLREIARVGSELLDADIFGPRLLGIQTFGKPTPKVSLRDLLTHRAGLRSYDSLRPDHPSNPLSEDRVVSHLGNAWKPAAAGDLSASLRHTDLQRVFGNAPPRLAESEYANEGFILLGELLGKQIKQRFDGFAEVVAGLFAEADASLSESEVRKRGVLLGRGRAEASARGESPAHPSSPTWCEDRFSQSDAPPLTLSPYEDNGPFLGGAAGLCVPPLWIVRLMSALHPRPNTKTIWDDKAAALAAGSGTEPGLGFQLGPAGYWTAWSADDIKQSVRVARLHHNGRIEGGAALLIHQVPLDVSDGAAAVTVVAAFNQLGPLFFEPDGLELLHHIKQLESDPSWRARDLNRSPGDFS